MKTQVFILMTETIEVSYKEFDYPTRLAGYARLPKRDKTLLAEKVKAQCFIKELERKRSEKRQTLFEAQDQIDDKKEDFLTDIEHRLKQHIEIKELFSIQWRMV